MCISLWLKITNQKLSPLLHEDNNFYRVKIIMAAELSRRLPVYVFGYSQ